METGMIKYISEAFDVDLPVNMTQEQLEVSLAEKINFLIVHDFSSLAHALYRIDVSEKKLKALLKENMDEKGGEKRIRLSDRSLLHHRPIALLRKWEND